MVNKRQCLDLDEILHFSFLFCCFRYFCVHEFFFCMGYEIIVIMTSARFSQLFSEEKKHTKNALLVD